jgi:four helix bundle protein
MDGQTGRRADSQKPEGLRGQALWVKAQEFAAEVAEVIDGLPHNRSADILGGQLLRSASSISANIAEGYGRYSQAAYRNHLSIARGSAYETESWLDLLDRRNYLPKGRSARLLARCDELQRLLTLRMKSLSAGKTYAVKEEAAEYEA